MGGCLRGVVGSVGGCVRGWFGGYLASRFGWVGVIPPRQFLLVSHGVVSMVRFSRIDISLDLSICVCVVSRCFYEFLQSG